MSLVKLSKHNIEASTEWIPKSCIFTVFKMVVAMHEFCRGGIFKKISDTWVHISILYVIIINKNNYVDKENTPKVELPFPGTTSESS